MTSPRPVSLTVNDLDYDIVVEPRMSLADALRQECRLTGTHLGCEQGSCGTCTVLCDGEPVRSCLMLAVQAEGRSIRTVEGLAASDGALHPVQQAFWELHGLQCGFCTPGFLMLGAAMVEQQPPPSDEEIDDMVASNLCRCTGYQNIRAAMKDALRRVHEGPPAAV